MQVKFHRVLSTYQRVKFKRQLLKEIFRLAILLFFVKPKYIFKNIQQSCAVSKQLEINYITFCVKTLINTQNCLLVSYTYYSIIYTYPQQISDLPFLQTLYLYYFFLKHTYKTSLYRFSDVKCQLYKKQVGKFLTITQINNHL